MLNIRKAITIGIQNGLKFIPQFLGLQIINFFSIATIIAFIAIGSGILGEISPAFAIVFAIIGFVLLIATSIYFLGVQVKFISNYSNSQVNKFTSIFELSSKRILRAALICLKIISPTVIGFIGIIAAIILIIGLNILDPFSLLMLFWNIEALFTPENIAIIASALLFFVFCEILSIIWFFKYSLGVVHAINTNNTYKEIILLCKTVMKGNKLKYFFTMLLAVIIATVVLGLLGALAAFTAEPIPILALVFALMFLIASIFTNNFYALTIGSIYHQLFSTPTTEVEDNLNQPPTISPTTQENLQTQSPSQTPQSIVNPSPQPPTQPAPEATSNTTPPIIPILADIPIPETQTHTSQEPTTQPIEPIPQVSQTQAEDPFQNTQVNPGVNLAETDQPNSTNPTSATEPVTPTAINTPEATQSQIAQTAESQNLINQQQITPPIDNQANLNSENNTFNLDLRQDNNNNETNNN